MLGPCSANGNSETQSKFSNINLKVPRSIIIATDYFDIFMDENKLWETALNSKNYDFRSENIYLKPMVQFSIETAILQGELLKIKYEHINFKKRKPQFYWI